MLRNLLLTVPIPLLALTQGAPAQSTRTSPIGLENLEGDESHFALFNPSYARFMQIDDTLRGTPVPNIKAIGFRRDGVLASASGGPRTLDLTVMMGHGDLSTATGTFATNYKGAPTTAFTRKQVNTPDWSVLAGAPAPFDFKVALDVPWTYSGNDSLVYELHMENVSQTGSPYVDRELGTSSAFTQGFGTTNRSIFGCLVQGFGFEMTHSLFLRNYGPGHPQFAMQIGTGVARAPSSQPTVLNIDVQDPNLLVPGLCARVHALPLISIPVGSTNSSGTIDLKWFDFPYGRLIEGVHFHTQAVSLDPNRLGIPVSLSEEREAVMPPAPRPPPNAAYLYAPAVATPSATLWANRAIITLLEN